MYYEDLIQNAIDVEIYLDVPEEHFGDAVRARAQLLAKRCED